MPRKPNDTNRGNPAYGVWADKSLGQHFLKDPRVIERIVQSLGTIDGQTVVEIGPGPGVLTKPLLAAGAKVVALEMDQRMVDVLNALPDVEEGRLTVRQGDALKTDWGSLLTPEVHIVGNLPYNVGTEIVARLALLTIEGKPSPKHMIFMLQKEVVQRICAKAADKHWGRLGVLCDWLCDREDLFDVSARCFIPAPKVTSSVVRLTPLPQPRYEAAWTDLDTLLRAGFGQRRKMLRASLRGLLTEDEIAADGIEPTARAETVGTEGWCRMARRLAAK